MNILDNWAKSITALLGAAHDVSSSVTNHSLLLGDSRESFIRDILSKMLPTSVVVGTGVIIDQVNNESNQIDIIIYRNDFPIFRTLGQSDVFLLEGVIATIEVKSKLTKEKLEEALENCKSVKKLKGMATKISLDSLCNKIFEKNYQDLDDLRKDFIHAHILPPTYIFSYRGYSSKMVDFQNSLNSWDQPISFYPDIICTEGIIAVKNIGLPYKFETEDKKWWAFVAKLDDCPLKFLLKHLVTEILSRLGKPIHSSTGIQYTLDNYMNFGESSDSWVGVLGDVVSHENLKLTPLAPLAQGFHKLRR